MLPEEARTLSQNSMYANKEHLEEPIRLAPRKLSRGKTFAIIGCGVVLMSCPLVGPFLVMVLMSNRPHHHPAGYDPLMAAINKKDAKAVEEILKSGVNPNTYPQEEVDLEDEDDVSALNSAAQQGSTEIVQILLDHGADPNMGDGWSYNPLSAAIGNRSTMELLIKRGAKVNDNNGNSYSLWWAAMDGKVEAVNFLLDHGANPKTNLNGRLIDALKEVKGSPEILVILRKHGGS